MKNKDVRKKDEQAIRLLPNKLHQVFSEMALNKVRFKERGSHHWLSEHYVNLQKWKEKTQSKKFLQDPTYIWDPPDYVKNGNMQQWLLNVYFSSSENPE